jgi:hypothetical protein
VKDTKIYDQESRLLLGSTLAEMSRKNGVTNADVEAMEKAIADARAANGGTCTGLLPKQNHGSLPDDDFTGTAR